MLIVVRIRDFLHGLSHCCAIAMVPIFLLLFGLIPVPGYAESGAAQGKHLTGYGLMPTTAVDPADPFLIDHHFIESSLLAQSEYPILDHNATGENMKPEKKTATVEPITRWVPLWGERVREMGYDLPLPFGIGATSS